MELKSSASSETALPIQGPTCPCHRQESCSRLCRLCPPLRGRRWRTHTSTSRCLMHIQWAPAKTRPRESRSRESIELRLSSLTGQIPQTPQQISYHPCKQSDSTSNVSASNSHSLSTLQRECVRPPMQARLTSRYILDYIQELDPDSRPQSPPGDQDFAPPSPSTFNRDAHFGYSPTPSPPPEIATQLTTEQLGLGMFKVEGLSHGMMASTHREDDPEAFRGRGSIGSGGTGIASGGRNSARTGMTSVLPAIPRRKRKDRESDVDDNLAQSNRKRGRG